jgi:hypothetical protein
MVPLVPLIVVEEGEIMVPWETKEREQGHRRRRERKVPLLLLMIPRYSNNQAQLVASMMEGVSMDRWSFPKAKESSSCYENALRLLSHLTPLLCVPLNSKPEP